MIYAVVLAAGASSRYGSSPPKQVELLPRVLDALAQSAVDGVVVVSGAHSLDVESVHCPDWERGPGASLRCGLAALPAAAEAAVVVLADGPELDPRAIDRVIEILAGRGRRRRRGGLRRACACTPCCSPAPSGGSSRTRAPKTSSARVVACDDLNPPGDVDVRG